MKQLKAEEIKICSRVKAIFQHPNGYTTILQRQDSFIYLYDEKLMSEVSVSKLPFCQKIQHLIFSKNFGIFYAYFLKKSLSNNFLFCPYVAILTINEQGKIQITKNAIHIQGQYFSSVWNCMGLLQISDKQQKSEIIIGLVSHSFSLVNTLGNILKQQRMECEKRVIKQSKSYKIKDNCFIITQQKSLMKAIIDYDKYQLSQQLNFYQKIIDAFIDFSSNKRYIGVLLQDQSVQIVNISTQKYKIYYNLTLPSFQILNLCFFYPAVNTSSTNKYKDKFYAIFTGTSTTKRSQRSVDRQNKKNIESGNNPNGFNPRNIHCFEFRQLYTNNPRSLIKLKHSNTFSIPYTSKIQSILFNEHQYNCIRTLNEQHQFSSYNLVSMLAVNKVDQEWIYLTAKFQQCHLDRSFYHQEQEDEFQNSQKIKSITQDELDDFSYSLFPFHELCQLKSRRVKNLIMF